MSFLIYFIQFASFCIFSYLSFSVVVCFYNLLFYWLVLTLSNAFIFFLCKLFGIMKDAKTQLENFATLKRVTSLRDPSPHLGATATQCFQCNIAVKKIVG